jgi:hypothetical protein
MALGLRVIYTAGTGLSEFAFGNGVKSRESRCFDALDTLPELSSSNDTWMEVDIESLARAMRHAYDARAMHSDEKEFNTKQAMQFNYEKTGNQFLGALNDIL